MYKPMGMRPWIEKIGRNDKAQGEETTFVQVKVIRLMVRVQEREFPLPEDRHPKEIFTTQRRSITASNVRLTVMKAFLFAAWRPNARGKQLHRFFVAGGIKMGYMFLTHSFFGEVFIHQLGHLPQTLKLALPEPETAPDNRFTADMLWLTNNTVRPVFATFSILPRHFF